MKNLRKNGNKGFTLAELLIVVAIIAVLAAVAIPVFTSQLNHARAATDVANIRSGYADIQTKILSNEISAVGAYQLNSDGSVGATGSYSTKGASADADNTISIGGLMVEDDIKWEKGKKIQYNVIAYGSSYKVGSIEAK